MRCHRRVHTSSQMCCVGPLSIVIGLLDLGQMKRPTQTRHIRSMGGIKFLCNKWHFLRQGIQQVYGILGLCNLTLAPSKTFIGQVKKGFDFWGYQMGSKSESVGISKASYQRLKRLCMPRLGNPRVLGVMKHWCKSATSGASYIRVILLQHITLTINRNPNAVSTIYHDALFLVSAEQPWRCAVVTWTNRGCRL